MAQQLLHPAEVGVRGRHAPDDPRLRVVGEEDLQRLLVAVGVQDQALGDGEVHDVLEDPASALSPETSNSPMPL